MEGDRWQATVDDISRCHKLSYEIKIVEIGPVVGAGELSEGFSAKRMYSGEVFFRFLSKMEGRGRQAAVDDISKGHNPLHEIKIMEIDPVVDTGPLVLPVILIK
ncbi:hypothetical protein AVEN_178438-1 [Araneus ventricosus]|uniref:Uncharacterized protein n=1 Tax=Araneus ventricosus TaxID=182803 RepID=A0A4Y2JHQ8_ARAVE|nr:hypothetical protein AVEN_178438-1 [Araneus ventricosus]